MAQNCSTWAWYLPAQTIRLNLEFPLSEAPSSSFSSSWGQTHHIGIPNEPQ